MFTYIPITVGKIAVINIAIPLAAPGNVALLKSLLAGGPVAGVATASSSTTTTSATAASTATTSATAADADVTAVLFCLYTNVVGKLNGGFSSILKSKFADVSCDIQHNVFILTITTLPNATAIGKCLSVACKALAPEKTRAQHKLVLRALDLRVHAEQFAFASNTVTAGLAKVAVAVTSSARLDKDKIAQLASRVELVGHEILKPASAAPARAARAAPAGVKTGSPLEAFIVHGFLLFCGIPASISDNVVVPLAYTGTLKITETKYESYMRAQVAALGDKLCDVVALSAAQSGVVAPAELAAASSITPAFFKRVLGKLM